MQESIKYTVPRYVETGLMRAFHNSTTEESWFPVHDPDINAALLRILPLSCGFDREIFLIGDAFRVYYNFSTDRFCVSA